MVEKVAELVAEKRRQFRKYCQAKRATGKRDLSECKRRYDAAKRAAK